MSVGYTYAIFDSLYTMYFACSFFSDSVLRTHLWKLHTYQKAVALAALQAPAYVTAPQEAASHASLTALPCSGTLPTGMPGALPAPPRYHPLLGFVSERERRGREMIVEGHCPRVCLAPCRAPPNTTLSSALPPRKGGAGGKKS